VYCIIITADGRIAAAQIGQGLEAEVQIFHTAGEISEVLELQGPRAKELLHA
jgi:hypothetical protein